LTKSSKWSRTFPSETAQKYTGSPFFQDEIRIFLEKALNGIREIKSKHPYYLYALDWLGFAHIVLALLFAGAIRDPVKNIWIVECGLIACIGVIFVAAICIPMRGLPPSWFLIDFSFAPAAALPLWIARRDIKQIDG